MPQPNCPLCLDRTQSLAIWQNPELRVIDAADPNFPGFTRVVWHDHVAEMTQLNGPERRHIMDVVWVVEQAQRDVLRPHKVNLAAFGNQVPHLHWHIIPRWTTDSHYPDSYWSAPPQRSVEEQKKWEAQRAEIASLVPTYHRILREALESM
jgi:diadenosine tetraphosphate (Ap4A) HIT family hydrolase